MLALVAFVIIPGALLVLAVGFLMGRSFQRSLDNDVVYQPTIVLERARPERRVPAPIIQLRPTTDRRGGAA